MMRDGASMTMELPPSSNRHADAAPALAHGLHFARVPLTPVLSRSDREGAWLRTDRTATISATK